MPLRIRPQWAPNSAPSRSFPSISIPSLTAVSGLVLQLGRATSYEPSSASQQRWTSTSCREHDNAVMQLHDNKTQRGRRTAAHR